MGVGGLCMVDVRGPGRRAVDHERRLGAHPGAQVPARLYYLSYALGVTCLLWSVADRIEAGLRRVGLLGAAALFLGQNSIWIYLAWHIPFARAVTLDWSAEFPLILAIACLLTWLQRQAVTRLVLPRVHGERAAKRAGHLTG